MKKLKFIIISKVIIILSFTSILISEDFSRTKEVENLRAFAKLYGYIRFFHPSDEASQVDWNKFAVYGVKKVRYAKNKNELKAILNDLFLPIAPTIQIYDADQTPPKPIVYNPGNTTGLQLITWQHQGIGLSPPYYLYKSVRLNRVAVPKRYQNQVYYSYKDKAFKDKQFKFSAYVKADVRDKISSGFLFLCAYGQSNKTIFEDFMRDRPIKSNLWQKDEISGTFNDNVTYLELGAELFGRGRLWIDNASFSIKNESGNWEEIKLENPGFEEANSSGGPESWKTYGKGYDYMITDKEKVNGTKSLLIKSKEWYITGCMYEKYPGVGEVVNKLLNKNLACQVPLALWSNTEGTIGTNQTRSIEPLLDALKAINPENMTAENEHVRPGNIIITWNIFQHFYPYFDVVDVDWDEELTVFLKEVLTKKNEKDFLQTLNRLIARLQDGHGYVYYKPKQKPGGLPIRTEWIENKVVITASGEAIFKKGDIIKSIDGVSGEEVLKNAEKFVSGSPQLRRYRALNQFGKGPVDSIAKIELTRDKKIVKVDFKRKEETRGFFFNSISEFDFPDIKKLDGDIYYINLNTTDQKEYTKMLDEIANAKGVIFDYRWDGKYDKKTTHIIPTGDIIPHLIDKPVKSANWHVPKVIYPDRKDLTFTKSGWSIQPKSPRFKAKVVFINTPAVVSYGETIMGIIEHYKLAEMVGDVTAGCNGNANYIQLPGGFRIMFTGMKVLKHDNSQHHLLGIKPTFPVVKTIKAVKAGRDEYLEKAIEVAK